MDYITCQKSLLSFVIINKCGYFLNIGVSYNIAVAASINTICTFCSLDYLIVIG